MSATPAEIKKALITAGFELYRTRGDEVQVADRVRDNLIMDSGISIRSAPALTVRVVVRAQHSDFPADASAALFDRARAAASAVIARGYVETQALASPMHDPVDASRTLDTWYEVSYEKRVDTIDEAMAEVGFALRLEKTAGRSVNPGR